MEKKIVDYSMNAGIDIVFVKCALDEKPDSPFVFVVTKEPGKNIRIIPFTDKERFEMFVDNFNKTYHFSTDSFLSSLRRTVFVDDMDKEYRIICGNQSVNFFAKFDALTRRAYITRSDIEDYPNNQNGI